MSVRRRPDAKTYFIDIRYRDKDGRNRRLRRSVGRRATMRDAREAERALIAEIETKGGAALEGLTAMVAVSDKTASAFSGFADHWYTSYVCAACKERTQDSYRSDLENHLVPYFGDRSMSSIGDELIDLFIAKQVAAGLAPKSINNHLTTLHALFAKAIRWGYYEQPNPVYKKKLKVPLADPNCFSEEEAEHYLLAAQQVDWYFPVALTALTTGLRRGELLGLRWKDILFPVGQIRVSRSLSGEKEGTPKSGRARNVDLHNWLAGILKPLKGAPDDPAFVRCDPKTKAVRRLTKDDLVAEHHRTIKRAGVKRIRFHDLRHTFGSVLTLRGVPLRVVQVALGHSTILMTERYSHLQPSSTRDAVNGLFSKREEPGRIDSTSGFGHGLGTVWPNPEMDQRPN